MYLYHITMFDKEFQTVLRPKIPEGNRKISRYKVWSGKSII